LHYKGRYLAIPLAILFLMPLEKIIFFYISKITPVSL